MGHKWKNDDGDGRERAKPETNGQQAKMGVIRKKRKRKMKYIKMRRNDRVHDNNNIIESVNFMVTFSFD